MRIRIKTEMSSLKTLASVRSEGLKIIFYSERLKVLHAVRVRVWHCISVVLPAISH